MTQANIPTLDRYWQALDKHLPPRFSPEERHFALGLYRELAKGEPMDARQLDRALLERAAIKPLVHRDAQGRIAGFGGLAAAPMHHRLVVDGRTLGAWCAWDTLFIPEILGKRARVASPDPETQELVELVVTPDGIEAATHEGAAVSFLMPDASDFDTNANVIRTFCHFVFFFASRSSGERWVERHPGTFLYTLNDAFALAKRLNARNFGAGLARWATAVAT
ncbi:MAG: organomercurial lyase [Betaproteobacteria bacterium]